MKLEARPLMPVRLTVLALASVWCAAAGHAQAAGAPAPIPAAAPAAASQVQAQVAQVAPPTGQARAKGAPITLEEYLQLVLAHNPDLQAERLNVAAAHGDTVQAGLWPNPVLSAARKPGEKDLGLEQPLPIFGQLSQRKRTAEEAEHKAGTDVRVTVAERLSDAGDAFIDTQIAQERVQVWVAARAQLEDALRIVQGQISHGARSRYDGERMALKLSQLQLNLVRAMAEQKDAASAMARLGGRPSWQPVAVGALHPLPESVYADADVLWEQARTQLPGLQSASAAVGLAEQQLALRHKEAIPVPSLQLMRVRSRSEGNYSQVGVSIELPLFDRKQGNIARAEAEQQQARYRLNAAEVEAKIGLQRSVQQYHMRRAALVAYEQREQAQHANLALMAQDAYRLGQGSILDFIDSLETLREQQLDKLDLTREMLKAQWAIRVALGQLPSN